MSLTPEVLQVIVFVVVGIAALIVLWKYHNTQLLTRLLQAAHAAVMAAEQAKATAEADGQTMTGDEQLKYAIDALKIIFPAANRFSDDQILYAIHAAVPVANAFTAQIQAAWQSITPQTQTPTRALIASSPSDINLRVNPPPSTPTSPTLGNMG